jgi:hypothetical protein
VLSRDNSVTRRTGCGLLCCRCSSQHQSWLACSTDEQLLAQGYHGGRCAPIQLWAPLPEARSCRWCRRCCLKHVSVCVLTAAVAVRALSESREGVDVDDTRAGVEDQDAELASVELDSMASSVQESDDYDDAEGDDYDDGSDHDDDEEDVEALPTTLQLVCCYTRVVHSLSCMSVNTPRTPCCIPGQRRPASSTRLVGSRSSPVFHANCDASCVIARWSGCLSTPVSLSVSASLPVSVSLCVSLAVRVAVRVAARVAVAYLSRVS